MYRKFTLIFLLFALPAVMNGCESALLNMKKDSGQREVRIQEKEQELQGLQSQQAALREKQGRLLSDLRKSQMDRETLSASVDELRRDNDRLRAVTEEQKKEKAATDASLKSYQQGLYSLKNDPGLTEAQKKKRIKELNKEILLYLDMGLK